MHKLPPMVSTSGATAYEKEAALLSSGLTTKVVHRRLRNSTESAMQVNLHGSRAIPPIGILTLPRRSHPWDVRMYHSTVIWRCQWFMALLGCMCSQHSIMTNPSQHAKSRAKQECHTANRSITAAPSGRISSTWQLRAPNTASSSFTKPSSSFSGTKFNVVPAKPPPWMRHAPLPRSF